MHKSRYEREHLEHRRCTRPGCDRDAVARLTYDIVACHVWIDGLDGSRGRTQELCDLHLGRLTIPRGWMLNDRRATLEAPIELDSRLTFNGDDNSDADVTADAPPTGDTESAADDQESVRDRPRQPVSDDDADVDDDVDFDMDSVPEELRAGSPLLARAFRAASGDKSLVEDTVNPPIRIPDTDSKR